MKLKTLFLPRIKMKSEIVLKSNKLEKINIEYNSDFITR